MRGNSKTTTITIILSIFLVLAVLAPVCHSSNEVEETTGFPAGWSDDIILGDPDVSYPNVAVEGNNIYALYSKTILVPFGRHVYLRRSNDAGVTWLPEQQLTTSGTNNRFSNIAVSGDNIHITYENGNEDEVYYFNSTNGGETWSNHLRISELNGSDSKNPDIAVSGNNTYIVWEDWRGVFPEVYYSNSSDGGITWSTNKNLTSDDSHSSVCARIAVNSSTVHVVWTDDRNSNVREVYYRSSYDGGMTWNPEKNITSLDFYHSEGQIINVWGTGIHMIWSDDRYGHTEIMYKNSSDNGITWNNPILLSGDDSYHSSHPAIDVWADTIHVVWWDSRDNYGYLGAQEVYYTNSTDGGITWLPPLRLTYAPYDSHSVNVGTNGVQIHVLWEDNRTGGQNDYRVYYKRYPDFPPDPTYNITLNEGWNLISTPLIPRDESIDNVLENISGKWDYIQAYDSINETWLSNATFKPDQLNDLKLLNHKMAFWINITEPGGTVLTVSGPIPDSTSINLYAGWNLVGYPSLTTETVANALWGTGADKVEKFDSLAPYRISEVGPTYVMKPGEGYWIHVPADTVWIINW